MSDFKNINDFRKAKVSKHPYQDPTYLSFLLLFDFADGVNSPFLAKPAEDFLRKLSDDEGSRSIYSEKLEALQNFKKALKTINNEMPWYWQGLSGLERIQQYNPTEAYFGGDDAKLTITTLESINLTVAGLMHLYRKAVFDENKWTYVLPANLRKFRMYVYVTEVRTIKNLSEPKISGTSLTDFPDNFKPSIGIDNKNSGISGSENRPYFMFSLKYCEFDIASGTTIFQDLQKTPEAEATGEIGITYEALYNMESRVLNGIVESNFNTDNISPSPDSENDQPDNLLDWAKKEAGQKISELADRAVTEMKTRSINRIQELEAEAKRQTVGRLNAEVNNIFQDFVQGVDRDLVPAQQTSNIKAAIADNVHGLTEEGNTIGEALNSAAKNSLGNVYGN